MRQAQREKRMRTSAMATAAWSSDDSAVIAKPLRSV
jgi:hypothetical protein